MDTPDDTARLFYLILLGMFVASYFLYDQRQKMSTTLQQAAIWGVIFTFVIIAYGFKDTLKSQLFPATPVALSGDRIALTRASDGHFYVTAQVNGTPVEFVVDTGASSVVLTREDARDAGFNPATLRYLGRAFTANGEVATAEIRLESFQLGDFRDTNIEASVNAGEMSGSLLGMSYLSRYRIEIDGNRLILTRR